MSIQLFDGIAGRRSKHREKVIKKAYTISDMGAGGSSTPFFDLGRKGSGKLQRGNPGDSGSSRENGDEPIPGSGKPRRKVNSATVGVTGFLLAILTGAILLMLPVSNQAGKSIAFIDALFTACTSVCVTGLVTVVPAAQFSFFGKLVILFLIQLGGWGVIVCGAWLMILLGQRINMTTRAMLRDYFGMDTLSGIVRMLIYVVKGSLLVEGAGALGFSFVFIPRYGFSKGVWFSIFHAVSAFCNAGVDLLGDSSLTGYVTHPWINFVTMAMIILGGLGFIVWKDLQKFGKTMQDGTVRQIAFMKRDREEKKAFREAKAAQEELEAAMKQQMDAAAKTQPEAVKEGQPKAVMKDQPETAKEGQSKAALKQQLEAATKTHPETAKEGQSKAAMEGQPEPAMKENPENQVSADRNTDTGTQKLVLKIARRTPAVKEGIVNVKQEAQEAAGQPGIRRAPVKDMKSTGLGQFQNSWDKPLVQRHDKDRYAFRESLRVGLRNMRIHTKMVAATTVGLILAGFFLVLLTEFNNPQTLGSLSFPGKLQAALFQSVTTRTAGFATVSQAALRDVTKFICCLFMLIGGSPVGTAGGIKTVTVAVLFATCWSILKGHEDTECFGRKVAPTVVRTAIIVVAMGLFMAMTGTVLLMLFEPDVALIDAMYEAVSAIATVGLTADLTPTLGTASKILIMIMMYFGRIGPITLPMLIAARVGKKNSARRFPEEHIVVG